MESQATYKIYSRKRFSLSSGNSPRKRKYRRKIKKIMPILIVIIVSFSTCYLIWNAVDPIFETVCKDEAKSIATHITNENSSSVIKQHNYDEFFTIQRDQDGNIKMISANVLSINQVTSDIAINIQKELDNTSKNTVKIPWGSVTGVKMLSGFGPDIKIKIASSGTVDTDLRSEFISQGVNQTLHRVYLNIECDIKVLTPYSVMDDRISNQFLFLENVILGEIPSTYYNLEGLENKDEIIETIE